MSIVLQCWRVDIKISLRADKLIIWNKTSLFNIPPSGQYIKEKKFNHMIYIERILKSTEVL